MNNKIASMCLVLVSIIGFIPLLIASSLSDRDFQIELAESIIDLWNRG